MKRGGKCPREWQKDSKDLCVHQTSPTHMDRSLGGDRGVSKKTAVDLEEGSSRKRPPWDRSGVLLDFLLFSFF